MNTWFEFKFRMVWPDNEPNARYWLDILIFDIIIREILEKNRDKIELWRIHRRGVKTDEAGHQFTFHAYTSEDMAKTINAQIEASPVLHTLKEADQVIKYFMERTTDPDGLLIGATSDKRWPKEIKQSWPYYIMGLSEMLLHLIDQVRDKGRIVEPSEGIDKLSYYYVQLNELITAKWQNDGQSPFLHHLNALFSYEPIRVKVNNKEMFFRF